MIFRIEEDQLFEVDFEGSEEQQRIFVELQNANRITPLYIYLAEETLPYNPYPTIAFYKLDENENVVLDLNRMLDNFKNETIATLNNMRDSMIEDGYEWVSPEDVQKKCVVGLEERDKIVIMALATATLLGQTENLFIISKDNITVPLTATEAKDLALKVFSHIAYIYYTARVYKDRILAATTFEEIAQILEELENQVNQSNNT